MRIFISGPLRLGGTLSREEIEKNILIFKETEKRLRDDGFDVFNPCTLPVGTSRIVPPLRECIRVLLDCDAIYLLPGWQQSPGARLEWLVASELKMKIIDASTES